MLLQRDVHREQRKGQVSISNCFNSGTFISHTHLDLCIQLGSHFQGIIINIIIDNMKTILAFLALATLASAQPSMRQACPSEKPLDCGGKYPLIFDTIVLLIHTVYSSFF